VNFTVALVWIPKEILKSPKFAVQIVINLYPVRKSEYISVQQGIEKHKLKISYINTKILEQCFINYYAEAMERPYLHINPVILSVIHHCQNPSDCASPIVA
jgi:hypothetical protein